MFTGTWQRDQNKVTDLEHGLLNTSN
jgi:hypothetical protein